MRVKKLAALVLSGVLCLTAFTGCGTSNEEVVATFGDKTVSYGVANFVCKYQKATLEDMYAMYASMYGVSSIWDADLTGAGATMEEQVKDSVMQVLHDLYTLEAHMADYGVSLTDEEKQNIDKAVDAFLAANSAEALEEMSATEEIVTEVLTLYTIQAKMYDAIIADADTNVTAEEANMRGYSVIEVAMDGKYDESYNFVKYTESEIAGLKLKLKAMDEALETKSMEDVAKENGMTVSAKAYAADDQTLDTKLKTALDSMKVGDVSDCIEVGTKSYFVRLDSETDTKATEENKEQIISTRQSELYNKVVDGWQKDDGWTVDTAVLEEISFRNVLTQEKEGTESTESTQSTETTETTEGTENGQ